MIMSAFFTSLQRIILSVLSLISSLFPAAEIPDEIFIERLDLSKFELVWEDDFNSSALDTSVWSGHQVKQGNTTMRKGGYWNLDFVTVRDGNLHISTKYYPDGYKGNGLPGWYSCGITSRYAVKQTFGYFEVRCILPKGSGVWSAFWMTCTGVTNVDGSGTDGAEIDIFESSFYSQPTSTERNRVTTNIHFDGYGAEKQSTNVCRPYITTNDPYSEYNTYGVEWNENEYIFYINGTETGRSSFGGTSCVDEWLMLTVEVGGNNGVAADSWAGKKPETDAVISDFIVDYVRVYQYK